MTCLAIAGCNSTPRIEVPELDAAKTSSAAMQMCDTNGDGFIAGAELDAYPGLKEGLKKIDKDSDGKITAAELESRFNDWLSTKTASYPVSCQFIMDGKALDGADIRFVPEPFFGDTISAATAQTDWTGAADMNSEAISTGTQFGYYRVEISKKADGVETIPEKFNAKTTVGVEVSSDAPGVVIGRFKFDLK